jgi:vacuolar-type H+-ATPase subunit E/Vma4
VKALGSPASVIEALRDEAGAEVERIEQRGREQAEALRGAADAAPVRLPDREARLQAARRRVREWIAAEDLADRRESLEERERWSCRVVARARRRLQERTGADELRQRLARLAAEGLRRLPGEDFELVVPEKDAGALDTAWLAAVARTAGKRALRVVPDREETPGGCLLRTADGRASFDNGFEARTRRLEPVWRGVLARLWGE